ncbi:unnamed protein product, partial [Cyprideis torosa]
MPCEGHSELMNTFSNRQEDSEVRVAAYLQLVACPSSVTVRKILMSLRGEKNVQVLSFVESHLMNSRTSAAKWKQPLRDIIAGADFSNKLERLIHMRERIIATSSRKGGFFEAFKYSKNYEISSYQKSNNRGYSMEASLLFHQGSFLPRAGIFNLTLDIFDGSINVLEVGGRVSGLERRFESVFGPRGTLPNEIKKHTHEFDRSVLERERKINDYLRGGEVPPPQTPVRTKRHTHGEDHQISTHRSHEQLEEAVREGKMNPVELQPDEPEGEVYVRVFGNELRYYSFGEDSPSRKRSKARVETSIRSLVFLDTSMVVPTALGLPLKVHINGTSSFTMPGSLKTESGKISGQLSPSGSLVLAATMTVDGRAVRSGVRVQTSLAFSGSMAGDVEMDSNGFSVKMDFPEENAFELKSEILSVNQAAGEPLALYQFEKPDEQKSTVDKCWSTGLGVSVCRKSEHPTPFDQPTAPYFPLNGLTKVRLSWKKDDPASSGILFRAKMHPWEKD